MYKFKIEKSRSNPARDRLTHSVYSGEYIRKLDCGRGISIIRTTTRKNSLSLRTRQFVRKQNQVTVTSGLSAN